MQPGSPWLLASIAVLSFVLAFVGAAVGLILGHLRLPLLIAYLGSPTAGAMTNLVISGTGAMGGAAGHVKAGNISWKGVALIGVPSMIGAIIAVVIFVRINPLWSYIVIGAMLVISGINLIRKKPDEASTEPITRLRQMILEVLIGMGLGALAAITGLMLGSLRLPMMIRYMRMDPKEAIGTNMVVGCLTALVGAATGVIAGEGRLNWPVLIAVAPPTVLGGVFGAWITGKISKQAVQRFAGWVIAFTGVLMVGQGVVGTVRKPRRAAPPIVQEWDDDDYYDLDYIGAVEMPSTMPDTLPPPPDTDDDDDGDDDSPPSDLPKAGPPWADARRPGTAADPRDP